MDSNTKYRRPLPKEPAPNTPKKQKYQTLAKIPPPLTKDDIMSSLHAPTAAKSMEQAEEFYQQQAEIASAKKRRLLF